MTKLDWRTVDLDKGILHEPTPDENRIILWLPGAVESGFQHWERLANVSGAEIAEEQGICFTQATSMPATQKLRGLFGKLAGWFGKPAKNSAWLLPAGGCAEQAGERQTSLLLVWSAEKATLDEASLEARWTGGRRFRRLGKNLAVVYPARPYNAAEPVTSLLGDPRAQAERLLAAARQAGDRPAEATALTDLGLVEMRSGEIQQAITTFEEALARGRQLGDRARENDALASLGTALVAAGQPARALEFLGQVLAYARETGDHFQEKLALGNLAAVLASTCDFGEALAATDHALTLAREIGDRAHEADLLWFQAIQQAELGRRDQAAALAQAAIDIHATLRSPHVGWLTSHLKRFRPITARTGASAPAPRSYYTGPVTAVATPAEPMPACDPSLLSAAMSAVKTMEISADSGMKAVPEATYQQRLDTCKACPHHTGMRCKLCGSFTSAKAWLPYERCPIGKWTS